MVLNAKKSEITFFSTDSHEASWTPTITVEGTSLPFNSSPKLLGIQYDRILSFSRHTKNVCRNVLSRCRVLRAVAAKSLGWRKDNLRRVYLALQQSLVNYAAPGWQPWLSKSMSDKLEVVQNKALRIITGQYQATPLEALRVELGIESYSTVSKRKCSVSYEKASRLPEREREIEPGY